MASVGHEGCRLGQDTGCELDTDEGQVDKQGDEITPVTGIDRPMTMTMTVMVMSWPVAMGRAAMSVDVVVGHAAL
jgi:hypothetical protein